MRAKTFKAIIKRSKRIQLQILLSVTARAFGKKGKTILFSKKPLEDYMLFSKDCADSGTGTDNVMITAYRLGMLIRKLSGLKSQTDLKELVYLLYENIGIKMTGELPNEFFVTACAFGSQYTPRECRLMSLMDSGIIAGIFYDKIPMDELIFSSRITEGCENCKAHFPGGKSNG